MNPWLWPVRWQVLAWTTFIESLATMQTAMIASNPLWPEARRRHASEVLHFPSPAKAVARTNRGVSATVVPLRPAPR